MEQEEVTQQKRAKSKDSSANYNRRAYLNLIKNLNDITIQHSDTTQTCSRTQVNPPWPGRSMNGINLSIC
jgi:hypothetical protein